MEMHGGDGFSLNLDSNSDIAQSDSHNAQQDIATLLTKSLAAYLILRAKEPISNVMRDLFDIERDAASVVDRYFQNPEGTTKLSTSLNTAFCFIPVGGGKPPTRDVSPEGNSDF